MKKGADNYRNELISKYNEYKEKEKEADRRIGVTGASLYRTKMRKIAQVFEKNFHEPIDKYTKG